MDALIALFSVLLTASASVFFWLSVTDGRRAAATVGQGGATGALEDLVGVGRPLLPHTIRQTRLE